MVPVVLVVAVVAFTATISVALITAGMNLLRRAGRDHAARIPVQGRVVEFTNFTQPPRVAFDYPGPDGRPLRATRTGMAQVTSSVVVRPGDPIQVYVNPQRPVDVSLGLGSVRNGWGLILIGAGALIGFGSLSFGALALSAVTA